VKREGLDFSRALDCAFHVDGQVGARQVSVPLRHLSVAVAISRSMGSLGNYMMVGLKAPFFLS
jgi:hypothetical protein